MAQVTVLIQAISPSVIGWILILFFLLLGVLWLLAALSKKFNEVLSKKLLPILIFKCHACKKWFSVKKTATHRG
jgi:hypothetical protein